MCARDKVATAVKRCLCVCVGVRACGEAAAKRCVQLVPDTVFGNFLQFVKREV